MPPGKEKKVPISPLNTTAQIQQIFSDVQSQLPSVNFDSDDQNENENDDNEDEPLDESNNDMLLESVLNNSHISFLTLHPKIETPAHRQHPPSVETQMRISPNLFDYSQIQEQSPPPPPVLSMDLFNNIDFDKIISSTTTTTIGNDHSPVLNLTPTFHRPRPITNPHQCPSIEQQTTTKLRDDRHVLERLAQQANKFNNNEISQSTTREHHPFKNLESALCTAFHEQSNSRHDKRATLPESERQTIYIDLRHDQIEKKSGIDHCQSIVQQSTKSLEESSSESDDENDGMLWFEKRRQLQKQRTDPSNQ